MRLRHLVRNAGNLTARVERECVMRMGDADAMVRNAKTPAMRMRDALFLKNFSKNGRIQDTGCRNMVTRNPRQPIQAENRKLRTFSRSPEVARPRVSSEVAVGGQVAAGACSSLWVARCGALPQGNEKKTKK